MGFSFRRKGDEDGARPAEMDVGEVHVVSGNDAIPADADLHIRRLKDQHRFDPFMQEEKIEAIDAAIESGNLEKETVVEASLLGENSPYAEVRAAVSAHLAVVLFDDPQPRPLYNLLITLPGAQHRRFGTARRHNSSLDDWIYHMYRCRRHELAHGPALYRSGHSEFRRPVGFLPHG
jgi:hypothetical protein